MKCITRTKQFPSYSWNWFAMFPRDKYKNKKSIEEKTHRNLIILNRWIIFVLVRLVRWSIQPIERIYWSWRISWWLCSTTTRSSNLKSLRFEYYIDKWNNNKYNNIAHRLLGLLYLALMYFNIFVWSFNAHIFFAIFTILECSHKGIYTGKWVSK